jgi:hypothetical protein
VIFPACSPALWQTIYNCIGVAVGLPFFSLCYIQQDSAINVQSLPRAEAQALPITAIFNWLLPLVMFIPGLTSLPAPTAQRIVACWFLTPLLFPGFQNLLVRILSSSPSSTTRLATKPVSTAYAITGTISGLLHLAVVLAVIFAPPAAELSLARVYIPDFSAVQWGQANTLTEGAHLFIQLDFWLTIVLVLILGSYMVYEPVGGTAERTGESVSVLAGVTVVCGPAAGMAYAAYLKESRAEHMQIVAGGGGAWSKKRR